MFLDRLGSTIPMRIKECQEDLRPAYNGMVGSEGQYITGVSVHQNSNDGTCFKDHMEQVMPPLPNARLWTSVGINGKKEIIEQYK